MFNMVKGISCDIEDPIRTFEYLQGYIEHYLREDLNIDEEDRKVVMSYLKKVYNTFECKYSDDPS